ncbi:hypothetical protein BV898_07164 [Hypsibius exemplaris]|uniref:Uncharacterized protein n=1 Tax=Hypsibius exemplaris TaxID=2072580 RepID=A0A1W0WU51_HYPEX|nr:hypothetical protein BV898_07164 [Hypsibius exemplaris]
MRRTVVIFTYDLRGKVCAARLADHAIQLPILSNIRVSSRVAKDGRLFSAADVSFSACAGVERSGSTGRSADGPDTEVSDAAMSGGSGGGMP